MTPDQINKIKAAAQMLRESAKQFRITGNPGHARNCEFHANEIEGIAGKHEVQNEFAGKEMVIVEEKRKPRNTMSPIEFFGRVVKR